MSIHNPLGTDGFEFLEFTTKNPQRLVNQFLSLGFKPIAHHRTANAVIYQQNHIRFIINTTANTHAGHFAELHDASACAMGFKVQNAQLALEHAIKQGARPYEPLYEKNIYDLPAIYGVGGSLIYFIDQQTEANNYINHFKSSNATNQSSNDNSCGLTYLDHVTHNLCRGQMDKWADFYTRIFNFREVRYFDIEGQLTGLKSRAMASPCGKIRIPLNESSDDKSQIEEFLADFHGEGIQHIALGSNDIFASVNQLLKNKIDFLSTPDTYYDLLDKRLPNHGESLDLLRQYRILLDGKTQPEKKLLLQIFTKTMLGPVFFEIIQRKGDDGFGEGNFKALFESIELDQIQRGILKVESTH